MKRLFLWITKFVNILNLLLEHRPLGSQSVKCVSLNKEVKSNDHYCDSKLLVVLTVLVFVHEMGHYLIARKNGVRVEVFSVGFGPEIIGWTDNSLTRWKICAIPGGICKMFGDWTQPAQNPQVANFSEDDVRVSFHHKSLAQKTAIVAAGPIANFLFAVLLLTFLFAIIGQKHAPPIIDKIASGSAAEEAGLLVGDR